MTESVHVRIHTISCTIHASSYMHTHHLIYTDIFKLYTHHTTYTNTLNFASYHKVENIIRARWFLFNCIFYFHFFAFIYMYILTSLSLLSITRRKMVWERDDFYLIAFLIFMFFAFTSIYILKFASYNKAENIIRARWSLFNCIFDFHFLRLHIYIYLHP